MKFKTAYNRGETTNSELGSETAPIYEYRIDKKTGRKVCVQCGETNIYEMIQTSAESSKLENIIKKATMGDITALNTREVQYLDITEYPTTLMEMQNKILKATQEFEKLPIEIKNKFDNSAERYISYLGTEEFNKIMGYKEEKIEKIETEVEVNE